MSGPGRLLRLVSVIHHIAQSGALEFYLASATSISTRRLLLTHELGLPKAEYAVGYFTEMGIGCRRDPLESNKWYVKAADSGDERAKHRLRAIQAAASGGSSSSSFQTSSNTSKKSAEEKGKKKWGLF